MSSIEEETDIVDSLAVIMKGKLRANSHKSHWRGNSHGGTAEIMNRLLKCARAEIDELDAAIASGNTANIRLESADVGNFMAMISDLARYETEEVDACAPDVDSRVLFNSHVLEEIKNIVKNDPLEPGDTLSHRTANECVRRGWAVRSKGRFIPTTKGRDWSSPYAETETKQKKTTGQIQQTHTESGIILHRD